jgi:uncharacterized protein
MCSDDCVSQCPTGDLAGSTTAGHAGRVEQVTEDLFDPPGITWNRVSPSLTKVRRILALPPLLVLAVAAGAVSAAGVGGTWLTILFVVIAVCALAGAGWTWVWAARNAASWGYAEAEDDLLVTGGLMFRRLVAVPYGRMQFVDVQAGPIDRAFGIATVTLHTASTETAADIPGLPADEATRLRNRLTELGESHGAGL